MAEGKVIGVISVKGGVGKTTTVSNIGTVLAKNCNKRVLIVDANFSAPNLSIHFGVTDARNYLHEVLLDNIKVENAVIRHSSNVYLLPASLRPPRINPYKLKDKIRPLKQNFDFILLDSSPNMNEEILSTMIASDELLVVTTPDYPTLASTIYAIKVAKERNTPITGVILNKVRNKRFELSVQDIEKSSGVPVLAAIPDDVKVLEALSATTPSAMYSPDRDVAVEYKKLVASLIGVQYNDVRLLSKFRKFFNKDVSKTEVNRELLRSEIAGSRYDKASDIPHVPNVAAAEAQIINQEQTSQVIEESKENITRKEEDIMKFIDKLD